MNGSGEARHWAHLSCYLYFRRCFPAAGAPERSSEPKQLVDLSQVRNLQSATAGGESTTHSIRFHCISVFPVALSVRSSARSRYSPLLQQPPDFEEVCRKTWQEIELIKLLRPKQRKTATPNKAGKQKSSGLHLAWGGPDSGHNYFSI